MIVTKSLLEKHFVRKHLVWLIIAAWVYTFTFIFNNYWSKYASYESVTKSFQKAVTGREKSFDLWLTDTSFVKQLTAGVQSTALLNRVKRLPFHVFIFQAGDTTDVPLFWSTNAVLPDPYHAIKKNTADIGYNPNTGMVFVPTFFGKTVVAYKLK